jgi:hypothetical protein
MKRRLKNILIAYSVFNVLTNVWRSSSVNGTKGNRTDPTSNPFNCKAVLTGVGLGAAKRDFITGTIR